MGGGGFFIIASREYIILPPTPNLNPKTALGWM